MTYNLETFHNQIMTARELDKLRGALQKEESSSTLTVTGGCEKLYRAQFEADGDSLATVKATEIARKVRRYLNGDAYYLSRADGVGHIAKLSREGGLYT